MTDFTKVVHDLPSTSGTLKLLGSFQKEYKFYTTIDLLADKSAWCRSTDYATYPSCILPEQEIKIYSPPPEFHS